MSFEPSVIAPVPGASKPDAILIADDVRKDYGGLTAVDVDHLEVEPGKVTALIGPNGAGKTTFFNVVTGFERATRGRWTFDGKNLSGRPAYSIAQRGMVRTFQLTKALGKMSVLENMRLAAPRQRGERFVAGLVRASWKREEEEISRKATELLERFGLQHMRDEYAATLSGGQRKLLEMARALMTDPKMLLLDEPVAGVNPALAQTILEHVRTLGASGLTILFVEHDMDVVMGISDWVVCMAEGRIIAEGPPQSVVRNEAVIDAYLGKTHGGKVPGGPAPRGPAPGDAERETRE